MDRESLLVRVTRHLRDLGVRVREDVDVADVEVAGRFFQRRLFVQSAANGLVTLREEDVRDALVIAEALPAKVRDRIRSNGGWFADIAGNAYITAPGILIDVRGRPRPAPSSRGTRTVTRNLFSAGRAQVIFVLLTWPEMLRRPVRELAEYSGVSVAMAYHTLQLLDAQNYLLGSHLGRRDELIDLWAGAYPLGLGKAIELGQFTGEPDPSAWADDSPTAYLSGDAASDDLVGPDMTLYVRDLDPHRVAMSRWRRPRAGERANITLRRTFWREPYGLDRAELELAPGAVRRAPGLLLYADLLASGTSRHQEAARTVRDRL